MNGGWEQPPASVEAQPVYAPTPSGDPTTDTANLQAAINAALERAGKLVTSSVTTLGTIEAYQLNATLTIAPPADSVDGFGCMDWEHHGYPKTSIQWVGANNGVMVSAVGWKRSNVTGVKLGVQDGITGVVCWNIDTTVAHPSTGFTTFQGASVNLGSGTGNIGWQIGAVSGGVADISFINWANCNVVGNNNNLPVVAGQIGWDMPGTNTLDLQWFGGGVYSCDIAIRSNGNDSKYFFGFGGSKNNTDFYFNQRGTLGVFGGRFEVGKRFLDVPNGSGAATIKLDNVKISAYAPADGIVFNMLKPGSLNLDGCYVSNPGGAAYTAAMITLGGFTGNGALHVRGGAIQAADPYWTKSYAGWRVYTSGVGLLNNGDQQTGVFVDTVYSTDTILQSALGILAWNHNPLVETGTLALTAGTVYAMSVPLLAGQVISRLGFGINVAGAGTVPTHIYIGLCDSTGKMLAQSADLAANAGWTSGTKLTSFPLSASYTVPTTGLYYIVILQVGAWGTTQMTLDRTLGLGTQIDGAGAFIYGTGGAGAAALPANGATLVINGASGPANFTVFAK
jgi:hypothetical protein